MLDVLELLGEWLPKQRWYAGGAPAQLRLLGTFELAPVVEEPGLRLITVAIVRDETTQATYQVPLVVRDVDSAMTALGYIGPVGEQSSRASLLDGAHDTAFARALLQLIEAEGEIAGLPAAEGSTPVRVYGQPMPGARIGEFATSRVLQGEQSNTSIICELRGPDGEPAVPLIVKIFRRLHAGDNPDVTLQTALAAAGSLRVPPTFGQLAGVWPEAYGEVSGHLAFAQEFFAGVEDAWRVALRAAEGGEDFAPLARTLGQATAEVHAVLRRVMPTVEVTTTEVETAIEQMWNRYEEAKGEVPQLAEYAPLIEGVYGRAADADWPVLQRIHGDYHLGQVLAVPERGWVLLDFEGEPMRPLSERNAPDVAVRDVAGMLRSFDYVAGVLTMQAGHDMASDWAATARAAFLTGYAEQQDAEGESIDDVVQVLDAYELDKAIYEALYEARHRPDWLPIPLGGIERILGIEPEQDEPGAVEA